MCSIAGLESTLSAVLRDVSFALCISVSSGSMFLSDCLLRIAQYYGVRTLFTNKVQQIFTVIVEPAIFIRTEMISSFDSHFQEGKSLIMRKEKTRFFGLSDWLTLEVSHSKRLKL